MSKVYVNMTICGLVDTTALAKFLGAMEQDAPSAATAVTAQVEEAPAEETKTTARRASAKDKVEETKTEETTGDDTVDLRAECGKLAKAFASANGVDAFKEVLAGFDVKNISGVPDDQLEDLKEKLSS